ncbi:MAG: nuclear transport factor 2 family protein [Steroidobacter sp.]
MNAPIRVFWQAAVLMLLAGFSAAQADPLTTQDYVEIQQLYARYNHAIDSGDSEGWAATFVPDGVFNEKFAGRGQLLEFMKVWKEKMNGANRRHWNSNLSITPAAQGANGTVLLMLLDVSTKPPSIVMTGQYTDVLVKTADGWRFKSRVVKNDATPSQAKP